MTDEHRRPNALESRLASYNYTLEKIVELCEGRPDNELALYVAKIANDALDLNYETGLGWMNDGAGRRGDRK